MFQQYSPELSLVPSDVATDVPSRVRASIAAFGPVDMSFRRHSHPEGMATGSRVKRRNKMLSELTNETDRQVRNVATYKEDTPFA